MGGVPLINTAQRVNYAGSTDSTTFSAVNPAGEVDAIARPAQKLQLNLNKFAQLAVALE